MNLTFEQFKEYLTNFLAIREESLAWEVRIPSDMTDYFDNTYTNNLGKQLDMTMELMFGDYWADVHWFLYEMPYLSNNGDSNISVEGREYLITDLNSYLEYAKKELEFKDEIKTTN